MIDWLFHEQFTRFDEIVFGFVMMMVGLYLEDFIDRIRSRKGE